jgi:hypothetical protein
MICRILFLSREVIIPTARHISQSFLSTHEGRELLAEEIGRAADRIESGELQIRWRYVKEPEYLLSEIADLDAERREFPLADEVNVRLENFITQDEIDSRLTMEAVYRRDFSVSMIILRRGMTARIM